jgi:methionyl-tRNA formyltransferase
MGWPGLNLVLLTGDGQEHRYVANRLDREIGLAAIVIDEGVSRTRRERFGQLYRKYGWRRLSSRGIHRLLLRLLLDDPRRRRQLEHVLGPDSGGWMTRCPILRIRGINGAAAQQTIRGVKPDRLLVYGTGIIGSRTLALGHFAPLNMHTGWSPDYRGSDCSFWPLYDRRLDLLGATVHELTPDVDGGPIYGRARPQLAPDDSVHSVFARCVQAGTDEYVRVLMRLDEPGLVEPEPQDLTRGREYRAVDLTLRADARVRWAIRRGLVRHGHVGTA